jgi:hypothetical protein
MPERFSLIEKRWQECSSRRNEMVGIVLRRSFIVSFARVHNHASVGLIPACTACLGVECAGLTEK